ncbi:MAG: Flp pilus assembly protein CpaB [Paracoccaceae bacterium]
MRMVFGLVLIVGLGLAGFATYMVKNYVTAYQTALAQERAMNASVATMIDIYVADKQLKYGDVIKEEDLRVVKFPENAMPEGTFTSKAAFFPQGENVLRTALRTIEKNEAMSAVKVTEPGESAGLTSQLERGKRAFAIKVDVASGVSGFLRPGDRVDVYWTGAIETGARGGDRGDVTKLIEAGVKLIAVDQDSSGEASETMIARTVTVAATPQQVAALAQAQSSGRLSLSLVGNEDDTVAEAIEVDQRSLLGIEAAPVVVQAEEEKICTIRTRRGADVVEIPIPCTN